VSSIEQPPPLSVKIPALVAVGEIVLSGVAVRLGVTVIVGVSPGDGVNVTVGLPLGVAVGVTDGVPVGSGMGVGGGSVLSNTEMVPFWLAVTTSGMPSWSMFATDSATG
jgi:hypothetical protein